MRKRLTNCVDAESVVRSLFPTRENKTSEQKWREAAGLTAEKTVAQKAIDDILSVELLDDLPIKTEGEDLVEAMEIEIDFGYSELMTKSGSDMSRRMIEARFMVQIMDENDCKFSKKVGRFIQKMRNVKGCTVRQLFYLRDIYYRKKRVWG